MEILKQIKHDISEQKEEMRNIESNITNTIIKNINEKFNVMEIKTSELEKKVNEQQLCIERLEKQIKRKNIILFGVEELEHTLEDLINMVLDIINNKMGINCQESEIEEIRRLGKKNDRVRPIMITLTTVRRRFEILKRNKSLETLNMYVKEDYPLSVLQKRKDLQEELKKERAQGKNAVLRYDKIVILTNHKERSRQQKRTLSESPKEGGNCYRHETRQKKIDQVPKKNKPNNIISYMNKPGNNTTSSSLNDAAANQGGTN